MSQENNEQYDIQDAQENTPNSKIRRSIITALRNVIDPDVHINIIDMGFIYRVEIVNEIVEVDYTLTTMGCPLADVIEKDIKDNVKACLKSQNLNMELELKLVWEPLWRLEFMSVDARIELGYPI